MGPKSKKTAEKYFFDVYRDAGRGDAVEPLPGLKRPEPPSFLFNMKTPSLKQLRRIVLKKRNKSAPGINGIPYIIFKKSPTIKDGPSSC